VNIDRHAQLPALVPQSVHARIVRVWTAGAGARRRKTAAPSLEPASRRLTR
jgi:hypothetical protein